MSENIVSIRRFTDSDGKIKARFYSQYDNLYLIDSMDLKELILTKENSNLFEKKIKEIVNAGRLKETSPAKKTTSSRLFLIKN